MKFVSYLFDGQEYAGIITTKGILEVGMWAKRYCYNVPGNMKELLESWESSYPACKEIADRFEKEEHTIGIPVENVKLLSPVPHPTSCRDGYAFRQHVAAARKNRGVEMIPEFDEYPVFYFTNHNAVFGEGEIEVEEDHLLGLDFELECAIVLGKGGKNIPSAEADSYIAGFMVMNDLSARTLQMEEMKLNLGPAKGKDFATTFGPYLVTPDELAETAILTPFGLTYNLAMRAVHNGKQVSSGNMKDMNWTFAELIERASYGVQLLPGDIIGSGTVGTGCYLELNGTHTREAKEKGNLFSPVWLQPDDSIELEIERLGLLINTIKKAEIKRSILAKKKMQ
ncbi:MAG: fumarylacetoacetate hydrolase family protein [Ignavibacteriales bacterium]|nr:fumarylacetoacetate hydrolase family protein [Ignavibacteriales bacterium]